MKAPFHPLSQKGASTRGEHYSVHGHWESVALGVNTIAFTGTGGEHTYIRGYSPHLVEVTPRVGRKNAAPHYTAGA